MSLAFNVQNLGPLAQIGLEIADIPTVLTLAYGGYKWLKPREKALSLAMVVENSNAVISAPPSSFRVQKYAETRNTGKGLSGFARLASGGFKSISMPKATTACDGDSGLQFLRALTTALLCFYNTDDTLRIFLKVLPGRLILSQLDKDEEEATLDGPIIAMLKKYIYSVNAEEEVDPVRKDLLQSALSSAQSLLQNCMTCEFDILGYNDDIGRVIGFLIWVLTPQSQRQPCYPTVSLSIWALSRVLEKLGLEVKASYPEIVSDNLYTKYLDTSGIRGGYDYPTYLITAPTGDVDPNCIFLPSGPTPGSNGWEKLKPTQQYITTTIRNVPFILARYDQAFGRLNMDPDERLFLHVYESLFHSIFSSAHRYLDGESTQGENEAVISLLSIIEEAPKHQKVNLGTNMPFVLNRWVQETWNNLSLKDGNFELYTMDDEKWRVALSFTLPESGDLGGSELSPKPVLFVAQYLEILIYRALAYAVLAHAFGRHSASNTKLDLEVRLAVDMAGHSMPFLRLERFHQIITEYYRAVEQYPAVSQPHWQDLAVTSWIPGYSAESELFLLYTHLITGCISPGLQDHKQIRKEPIVGIYFGGKTVLKRHFFDMHPTLDSFQSTLLIGEGLPLGLPLNENGIIGVGNMDRITNTEDEGMMLEEISAPAGTIKIGDSDMPGLRVDVEVDWEEDDTKVHLVTRYRGRRLDQRACLSSQITAGPKFGLLWMERMRLPTTCSCYAPSFQGSREFPACSHIQTSDIINCPLVLRDVKDSYIQDLRASFPVNGFYRRLYIANTKGCLPAQYHALQLFLDFILNGLYGELTMNWDDFGGGNLGMRRPGDFVNAIFSKIHFVNCVRCWEKEVVEKEEKWYRDWVESLKEPLKDVTAAGKRAGARGRAFNGATAVQGSGQTPILNLVSFIIAI